MAEPRRLLTNGGRLKADADKSMAKGEKPMANSVNPLAGGDLRDSDARFASLG